MKLIKLTVFLAALFCMLGYTLHYSWISRNSAEHEAWVDNEIRVIKSTNGAADNLDDNVLHLALTAYFHATQQGFATKPILTVIDYSLPSSEKRLWVFNLQTNRIYINTWVSHGKNSGGTTPTSFSNKPNSRKSSLGTFVTGKTYEGKHGLSLKLRGLEPGINDAAYARSIVIHGALYTNATHVGRSWGCPAVEQDLSARMINVIKNRSVVFSYFPDNKWISHSSFLR